MIRVVKRHAIVVSILASGVALIACACNTAKKPGRLPDRHRASAVACTIPRPAGTILVPHEVDPHQIPKARRECVVDADCNSGYSGRCLVETKDSRGGIIKPWSHCSYDECTKDSDCPVKPGACLCREMAVGGMANICVTAGCTSDVECGAGTGCSPTVPLDEGPRTAMPQFSALRCHTGRDECAEDGDCKAGGACAFSKKEGWWVCDTRVPLPPD
jgi:hypothetical protein